MPCQRYCGNSLQVMLQRRRRCFASYYVCTWHENVEMNLVVDRCSKLSPFYYFPAKTETNYFMLLLMKNIYSIVLTLQDLYIQVHSLDWLLYYITNYVCALSKSTLCQKYMKEYRRYFGHFLDWLLVLLLLYYLEENIYFYFDTIIIVSPGKAPNTYFTSSCIFGIMYYSITIFCISISLVDLFNHCYHDRLHRPFA